MKQNSNQRIENSSVVLVPYRQIHVEKYHSWMQSPQLQELTASNPLSLEEEYEMQKSWHIDEDKCTFIVLDQKVYKTEGSETNAMIGDTNLFIQNNTEVVEAEVEVMIAEPAFRRDKRGWNAILAMLRYGVENLSIQQYLAKIKVHNMPSISLFKKLKFKQEGGPNVFQELAFNLTVNNKWIEWLKINTADYVLYAQEN